MDELQLPRLVVVEQRPAHFPEDLSDRARDRRSTDPFGLALPEPGIRRVVVDDVEAFDVAERDVGGDRAPAEVMDIDDLEAAAEVLNLAHHAAAHPQMRDTPLGDDARVDHEVRIAVRVERPVVAVAAAHLDDRAPRGSRTRRLSQSGRGHQRGERGRSEKRKNAHRQSLPIARNGQ